METMGSIHRDCSVQDFICDEKNNIVSTPAYMLGQSISEVAGGIEKTINQLIKMTS
jgi:enhancing lycopene biosynthesis protein 2